MGAQKPATLQECKDNVSRLSSMSKYICLAAFAVAYVARLPLPAMPLLIERLQFTLVWQTPSVLMLVLGVFALHNVRAVSQAMDPVLGDPRISQVHANYVTNTCEQLTLSVLLQLIYTALMDEAALRLIPVIVALFVVGRIAYWMGYCMEELGRSNRTLGFGLSYFPSLCLAAVCSYKFILTQLPLIMP